MLNNKGWDTDMLGDIDHRLVVAPYLRPRRELR